MTSNINFNKAEYLPDISTLIARALEHKPFALTRDEYFEYVYEVIESTKTRAKWQGKTLNDFGFSDERIESILNELAEDGINYLMRYVSSEDILPFQFTKIVDSAKEIAQKFGRGLSDYGYSDEFLKEHRIRSLTNSVPLVLNNMLEMEANDCMSLKQKTGDFMINISWAQEFANELNKTVAEMIEPEKLAKIKSYGKKINIGAYTLYSYLEIQSSAILLLPRRAINRIKDRMFERKLERIVSNFDKPKNTL